MANRNNPQNRTYSSNRATNRDYGRDYNANRPFNDRYNFGTYYTPDYDFGYGDFYDYDYDTDLYPEGYTYTEYWFVPGPYVGYGPTDWQRSDENIREDVNERLTLHGQLDARQIHVQVENGVVTLTGNVNSRREKRLAEDITDSVTGVIDVQNRLHVENKNQGRQGRSFANQIHQGMEVDSRDNQKIGTVKEVRNNTILVDRPMKEDIFIPFSAFSVQNGKVMLNVNADQVNDQGWQTPQTMTAQSTAQSVRSHT